MSLKESGREVAELIALVRLLATLTLYACKGYVMPKMIFHIVACLNAQFTIIDTVLTIQFLITDDPVWPPRLWAILP